jgi:hypothetical protein
MYLELAAGIVFNNQMLLIGVNEINITVGWLFVFAKFVFVIVDQQIILLRSF